MDFLSLVMSAGVVLVGLLGWIVTRSAAHDVAVQDGASEEGLDLADGWDQSREPPHAWLMPIGLLFITGGLLSSAFALTMDVSAGSYSSPVNIDLVGFRTMAFVAAQAQWLLGWMLCCTRLIIRAVARFS